MIGSKQITRGFIIGTLSILIMGCTGGYEDLESYVATVKAKPAKPIEPVPTIKTYEAFRYEAQGLRNPFERLEEPEHLTDIADAEGPGPDLDRPKEELEAYPLDTLRMVGTLSREDSLWGLVKTNDGVIHRVKPGNYLGQNFGKIASIQGQQIDIEEWIVTTTGKWREREASLALVE